MQTRRGIRRGRHDDSHRRDRGKPWHALHDAAYLRHLIAMPDVELIAIQDFDASLVARRAAEVGSPPTSTDYRQMLATTRPDFVVALGRHRQMADLSLPDGEPMGIDASEVEAVAAKADRLDATEQRSCPIDYSRDSDITTRPFTFRRHVP